MTWKINHAKVSTGTDNPAYDINPSDWNADLVSTGQLPLANGGTGASDAAGARTALGLATVAASGAYADLSGKPTLFSGAYADLTGKPTLFSGAYADLSGKPGNFSSSAAGFTPASGGGTTNFLRADGTWAAPAGGSASLFTSSTAGIVPASGGGTSNFLRADGTWAATGSASVASGFDISAVNPTVGGDPARRRALGVFVDTDHSTGGPGFTNETGVDIELLARYGQNVYAVEAEKSRSKTTFMPLSASLTSYAAGQKFVANFGLRSYGMGDNFLHVQTLDFAGANIAGDEGTGINSVSYVRQQPQLTLYTIESKTVATLSTTITQVVTESQDPQTVTVASTSGANVGDWLVIGQEMPTGYIQIEAVQITAIGSGTITGVFRVNCQPGTTLTPALVLNIGTLFAIGEQRWLVNLSATPYNTGSISGITHDTLTGSGTSWSSTMAGGIALNPGAISLDADTYSGPPFNGSGTAGPLRSWYQIKEIASATSLKIHSFSCSGDAAYRGKWASGSGGYVIRPAARVLRLIGTNTVVCESVNPATWAVGNTLELAIAPYPDVTGQIWYAAGFTPAGNWRGWLSLDNRGARTFGYGFGVKSNMTIGGNADTVAWENGFVAEYKSVNYGTFIEKAQLGAHKIGVDFSSDADIQGKILWAGYNTFLSPDYANFGMKWSPIASGDASVLQFKSASIISTIFSRMEWNGEFKLARSGGSDQSYKAPFYLGSYALWVDSTGALRKKSSAPTADMDGTALGSGGGYSGDIGTLATMGGTTNAYPAFKRNGTAVEVRLADDSALTRLDVGSLYVGGVAVTGGSGGYTGDIGTFATMGGTTSSFPALKRSTTGIQVRLADDSALAPLTVGSLTVGSTAITGAWADITGKPTFATVATTGAYTDLTGRPSLATVATSGAYADLTGKPVNFTSTVAGLTPASGGGTSNFLRADGTWAAPVGYTGDIGTFATMGGTTSSFPALKRSTTGIQVRLADDSGLTRLDVGSLYVNGTALATVATSGAYSDLTGAPSLATVATSGAYADLTGKPGNFSSTVAGLAPASGGGTANFLRADGTWAAPSGGGSFSGDIGTLATMGGSTSSFPALKRNGTKIEVKLADDSALTRLDVGSLYIGGTTQITGAWADISGKPSFATVATSGAYSDLTGTPGNFSSSTAGLAPASGGGTSNFLRADGTWAAPSGGGGSSYSNLFQAGSDGLEVRNGTSPQSLSVYNTYTDSSNYQGFKIAWESGSLKFGAKYAGTGGAASIYYLGTNHNFMLANESNYASITCYQLNIGGSGTLGPGGGEGKFVLTDEFSSGFERLMLGGTSSSYPAIKRNGTEIIVRLADDSGDAPLKAASLILTGLPTSNPGVAGKLWNSSGTLMISAG